MEKGGGLNLEEALLNEIYNNPSLKRKQAKRVRYPPTLESLDTGFKSLGASRSTSNMADGNYNAIASAPSSTKSLKPLPVQDFHRVSDLMHRVSSVSGYAPDQSELSPINKSIPENSADIAANMQEYQLKAMKDSNSLRETMDKVIQLHELLQGVVTVHLMHRKELSKEIEDINNQYIKLFEVSLSEMLKTQRQKFKSQTQDVERLKAEVEELKEKLAAAVKTSELQSEKILNLRSALFETDETLTVAKDELTTLRVSKVKSDAEKREYDERLSNAIGNARLDFENKLKKLRLEHQQLLSSEQLKFAEERHRLTQKQQTTHVNQEKMVQELAVLREKAKALDSLATSVQQRRPLRDNSCQTQVTDAGLWDKQDGWILPISRTARIRNLWRAGMKFAACRACRGVGKYVHKVGAILRRIQRGKELIKETIVEGDLSKWSLPDECVRFMSNLPKTAQAFRPHNLAWTVRCVYHLYALKYAADREDDALGYLRQSFADFVIERYLMSTENRADAELHMYHLMRSIREHYPRHPAVQLCARFIGVLDAVTPEEYADIQRKQNQNEAALKRKREEGLKQLGARERVKQIKDEERRQEIDTIFKNPENVFHITTRALSMDILSIMLYARNCMLFAPYVGVYAVPIALAKRHSSMQQTQAHQLRMLPPTAFAGNTIMPEVYQPDYASMYPQPACVAMGSDVSANADTEARKVVDPVPMHLCIGEKSQHWVPMDRAVAVVKQLLYFLPLDELTTVYRAMEFNATFLMDNGLLHLPEGTHTLIRSAIRLFATSPVQGGFDLSWHDLYHSVADLGNQNEYSAHFIKTLAAKETIVPVPEPIVVPIVGTCERAAPADSDHESGSDDSVEDSDDVAIMRRLCYTRDPAVSYMDRKMTWEDYRQACRAANATPACSSGWNDSYGPRPNAKKLIIQDELLGNHAHLKHYRHIHPQTIMVNLDATLQVISEAMLNKSASVGVRIQQIFLEGDTNHDGVLSFSEFMDIVKKVAPEYHERKILKMFCEALMGGDDNECIGPEAFLEVCTAYGLIKISDISGFAQNQLRALSDPPIIHTQNLTVIRTELPKDKSEKVSYLKSPKKDRRQSLSVDTSSRDTRLLTRASFVGIEQLPSPLPSVSAKPGQSKKLLDASLQSVTGPKLRNERMRRSMEMAGNIPEMEESAETTAPPEPAPVPQPVPEPVTQLAPPSLTGLRIASLDGVTVATDKDRPLPKLATRVRGQAEASPVYTPAGAGQGTALAGRQFKSDMSDDVDSPLVSPLPKPKLVGAFSSSALPLSQSIVGDVSAEYMEEQPRMFALDPTLAEAHMAEVRGVRLNEAMSKAGASKLLEQLRLKKESRLK